MKILHKRGYDEMYPEKYAIEYLNVKNTLTLL